jgi:tetratricopeptide (TPR) repeat protein
MYNTKSRYVLVAIFALSCLASIYYSQYQLAAIAGFLALFIVWAQIKQGTVLQASKHFKNQDYDRAEQLLSEIKNPETLAKNRRGYYEFMQANIALQREDFEKAEYHFQIASRFPLGGKNDTAYVLIHLANLALRKKDAERAKTYLGKAKELATTSRAKEIIKTIEKEADKLAEQ